MELSEKGSTIRHLIKIFNLISRKKNVPTLYILIAVKLCLSLYWKRQIWPYDKMRPTWGIFNFFIMIGIPILSVEPLNSELQREWGEEFLHLLCEEANRLQRKFLNCFFFKEKQVLTKIKKISVSKQSLRQWSWSWTEYVTFHHSLSSQQQFVVCSTFSSPWLLLCEITTVQLCAVHFLILHMLLMSLSIAI